MSIAGELGTTVDELFRRKKTKEKALSCVMHSEDRKTLVAKGGIQSQLISRGIDVPFEFIELRFPPGAVDGTDLHTHEGVECGLVIQGELTAEFNNKIYSLGVGDSFTLTSTTPHRLSNNGDEEAVAIWVDSKPVLFTTS
jgi:mannose-6-phosphate isomerase-like protein (cupin superfamily)